MYILICNEFGRKDYDKIEIRGFKCFRRQLCGRWSRAGPLMAVWATINLLESAVCGKWCCVLGHVVSRDLVARSGCSVTCEINTVGYLYNGKTLKFVEYSSVVNWCVVFYTPKVILEGNELFIVWADILG